jgi:alkanesulfonate monooxygenase SsuD/methylene tetrahydromethanopterin reductase-like flavin-dependent oxidoreductase (luciferase family)
MTGPKTVESHVVPLVTAAASSAGRPAPRVVVGLPIRLTNDPDGARAAANKDYAIYGTLPSYRAMLDREGAAGPGDIALVGDEAALTAGLQRVRDAGATDFEAAPFGNGDEIERTLAYLASRPS